MGKKYKVSCKIKSLNNKKVYLVTLSRTEKNKTLQHWEIMGFVDMLGLHEGDLDHPYIGYNVTEFVSNKNFDLALFYIAPTATVSFYILCKNEKARKKLESLLKEVKDVEREESFWNG